MDQNHYIDHIDRPAQEPMGYCRNPIHQGLLSKAQIKSHRCREKKCPYLEKYDEEHARYWKRHTSVPREDKSEYRQLRKDYFAGRISVKQYLKLKNIKEKKPEAVYQYFKEREYEKAQRRLRKQK